jgi:hypothetical protein
MKSEILEKFSQQISKHGEKLSVEETPAVETAKVEVAYIKALETNRHTGFVQLENK